MSDLDTSADAVERLAALYDHIGLRDDPLIAATLRALAGERDAAADDARCAGDAHRLAIEERDAARAEIERLRSALRFARDHLPDHLHPPVNAALTQKEGGG